MMAARNANAKKGGLRSDKKKVPMNKRLGQNKPRNNDGIVKGDARLKIIQKNRTKVLDARDKLAQIAKKKDAREKLTKLREARLTGQNPLNVSFFRPVGPSITMKKDRNGKISLSTNKASRNVTPAVSLGYAVQRQLGLVGALQSTPTSGRQVQRKNLHPVRQVNRSPIKRNIPVSTAPMRADGYPNNVMQEDFLPSAPPPVIRRTIRNDIVPELPPLPAFSYNPIESSIHNWAVSTPHGGQLIDARRKRMMKVVTRNDYNDYDLDEPRLSRPNARVSYIDLDVLEDTQPLRLAKPPLTPGIRARLDTPSQAPQSHGIFSKTRPKAIVSPGHRIVVSNLHTAVTQEDITELFADIGDLMVARLVRPGTAEVIYKNLPDAEKAVEVYHNRQLDGQPMKCLLVNKRPANNPTAPAVTKSVGSTLRITSAGGIKKPASSTKVNKLVPDLNTIHKVLFNRT